MKVRMVPLDDIVLSGDNMREDVGEIDELSWSIRNKGVLQPLILNETDRLELIAGHRRLAAARRAGLKKVPCIVHRDLTEDERLDIMVHENVHRKSLSPLEEANAFRKLADKGATQAEIGHRIGKSAFYVQTRLALLQCDEETQQKVHRGELSIYKAVDVVRKPRGSDKRRVDDPNKRWQHHYIDRLVGWLEAGKVNLDDDETFKRLMLLSRALKALADRKSKRAAGGLPQGIKMCETCGTVVDVEECCEEHGDLCGKCKAEAHGEAA